MTSETQAVVVDARLISDDQVQIAKTFLEALEIGLLFDLSTFRFPSWPFIEGSVWSPVLQKFEKDLLLPSSPRLVQSLHLLHSLLSAYEGLAVCFSGWPVLIRLLEEFTDLAVPLMVSKILKLHPHFGKRRRTPLSGGRIGSIFPCTEHGICSTGGVGSAVLNCQPELRDSALIKKDEEQLRKALTVFVSESHSDIFVLASKPDLYHPIQPIADSLEATYMTRQKQFKTVTVALATAKTFSGDKADVAKLFPDAADHELGRLTFRLWLAASLADERLLDVLLELSLTSLEILIVNFPSFFANSHTALEVVGICRIAKTPAKIRSQAVHAAACSLLVATITETNNFDEVAICTGISSAHSPLIKALLDAPGPAVDEIATVIQAFYSSGHSQSSRCAGIVTATFLQNVYAAVLDPQRELSQRAALAKLLAWATEGCPVGVFVSLYRDVSGWTGLITLLASLPLSTGDEDSAALAESLLRLLMCWKAAMEPTPLNVREILVEGGLLRTLRHILEQEQRSSGVVSAALALLNTLITSDPAVIPTVLAEDNGGIVNCVESFMKTRVRAGASGSKTLLWSGLVIQQLATFVAHLSIQADGETVVCARLLPVLINLISADSGPATVAWLHQLIPSGLGVAYGIVEFPVIARMNGANPNQGGTVAVSVSATLADMVRNRAGVRTPLVKAMMDALLKFITPKTATPVQPLKSEVAFLVRCIEGVLGNFETCFAFARLRLPMQLLFGVQTPNGVHSDTLYPLFRALVQHLHTQQARASAQVYPDDWVEEAVSWLLEPGKTQALVFFVKVVGNVTKDLPPLAPNAKVFAEYGRLCVKLCEADSASLDAFSTPEAAGALDVFVAQMARLSNHPQTQQPRLAIRRANATSPTIAVPPISKRLNEAIAGRLIGQLTAINAAPLDEASDKCIARFLEFIGRIHVEDRHHMTRTLALFVFEKRGGVVLMSALLRRLCQRLVDPASSVALVQDNMQAALWWFERTTSLKRMQNAQITTLLSNHEDPDIKTFCPLTLASNMQTAFASTFLASWRDDALVARIPAKAAASLLKAFTHVLEPNDKAGQETRELAVNVGSDFIHRALQLGANDATDTAAGQTHISDVCVRLSQNRHLVMGAAGPSESVAQDNLAHILAVCVAELSAGSSSSGRRKRLACNIILCMLVGRGAEACHLLYQMSFVSHLTASLGGGFPLWTTTGLVSVSKLTAASVGTPEADGPGLADNSALLDVVLATLKSGAGATLDSLALQAVMGFLLTVTKRNSASGHGFGGRIVASLADWLFSLKPEQSYAAFPAQVAQLARQVLQQTDAVQIFELECLLVSRGVGAVVTNDLGRFTERIIAAVHKDRLVIRTNAEGVADVKVKHVNELPTEVPAEIIGILQDFLLGFVESVKAPPRALSPEAFVYVLSTAISQLRSSMSHPGIVLRFECVEAAVMSTLEALKEPKLVMQYWAHVLVPSGVMESEANVARLYQLVRNRANGDFASDKELNVFLKILVKVLTAVKSTTLLSFSDRTSLCTWLTARLAEFNLVDGEVAVLETLLETLELLSRPDDYLQPDTLAAEQPPNLTETDVHMEEAAGMLLSQLQAQPAAAARRSRIDTEDVEMIGASFDEAGNYEGEDDDEDEDDDDDDDDDDDEDDEEEDESGDVGESQDAFLVFEGMAAGESAEQNILPHDTQTQHLELLPSSIPAEWLQTTTEPAQQSASPVRMRRFVMSENSHTRQGPGVVELPSIRWSFSTVCNDVHPLISRSHTGSTAARAANVFDDASVEEEEEGREGLVSGWLAVEPHWPRTTDEAQLSQHHRGSATSANSDVIAVLRAAGAEEDAPEPQEGADDAMDIEDGGPLSAQDEFDEDEDEEGEDNEEQMELEEALLGAVERSVQARLEATEVAADALPAAAPVEAAADETATFNIEALTDMARRYRTSEQEFVTTIGLDPAVLRDLPGYMHGEVLREFIQGLPAGVRRSLEQRRGGAVASEGAATTGAMRFSLGLQPGTASAPGMHSFLPQGFVGAVDGNRRLAAMLTTELGRLLPRGGEGGAADPGMAGYAEILRMAQDFGVGASAGQPRMRDLLLNRPEPTWHELIRMVDEDAQGARRRVHHASSRLPTQAHATLTSLAGKHVLTGDQVTDLCQRGEKLVGKPVVPAEAVDLLLNLLWVKSPSRALTGLLQDVLYNLCFDPRLRRQIIARLVELLWSRIQKRAHALSDMQVCQPGQPLFPASHLHLDDGHSEQTVETTTVARLAGLLGALAHRLHVVQEGVDDVSLLVVLAERNQLGSEGGMLLSNLLCGEKAELRTSLTPTMIDKLVALALANSSTGRQGGSLPAQSAARIVKSLLDTPQVATPTDEAIIVRCRALFSRALNDERLASDDSARVLRAVSMLLDLEASPGGSGGDWLARAGALQFFVSLDEELWRAEQQLAAAASGGRPGASAELGRLLPFIHAFVLTFKKDGGRLASFAEAHKSALNILIRSDTGIIGNLAALVQAGAHCLDFDNKRAVFRWRMKQASQEPVANVRAGMRITVRRAEVFTDSYHQLRHRDAEELKGRLVVQFMNEEGVDAGGLLREWYSILAREIFNPMYALFTVSPGKASTFLINPNSAVNPDHLHFFEFCGKVLAKAIYDNVNIKAYFGRSLYKQLLGRESVDWTDMEQEDPEYYKQLRWVLDTDLKNNEDAAAVAAHMSFTFDRDTFGSIETVELMPGGNAVMLAEDNKQQYVKLLCEYKMSTLIQPQLAAFLRGFHALISKEALSLFDDKELELLISGLPDIDIADLKANVELVNYNVQSPQIQWLWRALEEFSSEERALFLQFVTGSSQVPLEGFKALAGMRGPQKISIHRAYSNDRLPSAHTCFNQLDLPEYPNYDTLRDKLRQAVGEGSEGFGFV